VRSVKIWKGIPNGKGTKLLLTFYIASITAHTQRDWNVFEIRRRIEILRADRNQFTWEPLSVDVFPPGLLNLLELQQDGVEGRGFESADPDLDDGEHPAAVLGDDHLVGEVLELGPELGILQLHARGAPTLGEIEYSQNLKLTLT